jgi:hypothetical protein
MESMNEHKGKKIATPYFLKNRATREIMILMIIMVVIGKYIFRLGLSIIISPGRRPMGSLPSHGHRSPTARNIAPRAINIFCMTTYSIK